MHYADLIAESIGDAREKLGTLRGTMPLEEFVIEILVRKDIWIRQTALTCYRWSSYSCVLYQI